MFNVKNTFSRADVVIGQQAPTKARVILIRGMFLFKIVRN